MKILQVNTEKGWRGGERQTLITMEALRELGIEVALIAKIDEPLFKKATGLGFEVIGIKNSFDTFVKLSSMENKFDCIHAQSGKSHTETVFTKFLHRTPLVYTRRVDFSPKGYFTKLKYRHTDMVVSISNAISRILDESKIYHQSPVIYSALKTSIHAPNSRDEFLTSLGIDSEVEIIGVVAALEEHKDPLVAVNTLNEITKERKNVILLHFGVGSMHNRVLDHIKANNLQNSYLLMGYKDNVEEFFPLMDVFLMTSKMEGMGSSVIDAFLNQVPVVSTNAGGLNELIHDRGDLCEVGDHECLSKNILDVLNQSEIGSSKKVLNAYGFAKEELSYLHMGREYIKIYEQVAKK